MSKIFLFHFNLLFLTIIKKIKIMEFSQTTYVDNPEYNEIVFTSNDTRVEIGAPDLGGDTEFFITQYGESISFLLTRENVQQLMDHFKNQL